MENDTLTDEYAFPDVEKTVSWHTDTGNNKRMRKRGPSTWITLTTKNQLTKSPQKSPNAYASI